MSNAAPSFIGRAAELDAFDRLMPNSAGDSGCLITICGEAGMGKTRLMSKAAEIAKKRGARVLWSQMIEEPGAPPYFPWKLVLRSCIQQCDEEQLLQDLGSGAPDIADIVPELRDRIATNGSWVATDSNVARYQLFDSVTRFLLSTAARQPLVFLFDNLHLADRSSLGLLEYFCHQIVGSPILIIGAYRDTELSRRHPLRPALNRLSRSAGYSRISLAGLTETEVAELLHSQLGYSPPSSLVNTVYRQSDGNPLFVVEVGSMLASRSPDQRFADAGFRFEVPASLRDVIGARLDELPAETSGLLRVAAVIGRDFDVAVVADLAKLRPERASRRLNGARLSGVVDSIGLQRYRFHHALYREVLYAEHSTLTRARLHRDAGELLEARYAEDLDSQVTELAHHFSEAVVADNEQKAVHYCCRAAEAAIARRAYGEAAALLDRALQAAALDEREDPSRHLAIMMAMGKAQYQSGELNAATPTLMKAAVYAHRHQHWERLADALFIFQLVCQQSGQRHIASIPLHHAVLEQLPEDSRRVRARTLASLAKAYRTAAQPGKAAQAFRESVTLARRCDDPTVLLDCLCKGNWTIGRKPASIKEGLEISRESLDLAKKLGRPEAVLDAVVDIIFQLCDLGEIEEVEQQLAVLRQLAMDERQPHFLNVLMGFETALEILQGKWNDALLRARKGIRLIPLQGVLGLQGRFAFQVFAIKKAQGSLGQVRHVAERIIASSGDARLWLPGQVLLQCELGQLDRARTALQKLGDLRELPQDDLYAIALAYLAEASARLGDTQRCNVLYELLIPYRGLNLTLPGTLMLGAASGYLALLAAAMRRNDDAAALFEEALAMNAALGAAPALAQTQVEYARLLMAHPAEDAVKKAQDLLAKAQVIATELGLYPVARTIEELAAGVGASGLTNREVDILKIVATGLTNSGIADTLNVSHSTVATHLRNIFGKLNVANRTEAAEFARRAGLLDET